MRLLFRWSVLALAIWIATALLPGITVTGGFWAYLWVALLFGLINTFIGSLLKFLTLPAMVLTLGLFNFVINAAMLELTSRWSTHFDVKNFSSALLGALVISLVTWSLNIFTKKKLWR
jgi:putative membrane protein